jgi:hypothetical protein
LRRVVAGHAARAASSAAAKQTIAHSSPMTHSDRRTFELTDQSMSVARSRPITHATTAAATTVGAPNSSALRHRRWTAWPRPGTSADAVAQPTANGTLWRRPRRSTTGATTGSIGVARCTTRAAEGSGAPH